MADPKVVFYVAAVVIAALVLWVGMVLARAETRTAPGLFDLGGPKKPAPEPAPDEAKPVKKQQKSEQAEPAKPEDADDHDEDDEI